VLFRLVVAGELLVSYLVGVGALLAAFAAAFVLTPLQLGAVTTVVLVVVAGWETVVRVRAGTDDEKAG
jgi:low temperature requirement protein LtrA